MRTWKCSNCKRTHEYSFAFTVECECGAFYNGAGQGLSHPSQWGEETGERFDNHGQYIGGGEDVVDLPTDAMLENWREEAEYHNELDNLD